MMRQPRASINSGSMCLVDDSPYPDDDANKVLTPATFAVATSSKSKRISKAIIDNASLKRLRSDSKAQKSQKAQRRSHKKSLQKEALSKLETTVRYKLDMLLLRLDQSATDFHFDDRNKRELKPGDLHGLLETLLSRLTQLTEEFIRRQTQCKEQSAKWKALRSEWSRFEQRFHIRDEHQLDLDHGHEPGTSSFDVHQRFQALGARMAELERHNREMQLMRNMEFEQFRGEYLAKEKENNELLLEVEQLQDERHQFLALRREFSVEYKAKLKAESENKELMQQIETFEQNAVTEERIERAQRIDYGTQTECSFQTDNEHLRALQSDNAYLSKELDAYIAESSRFKHCTERHHGDIQTMAVSPIAHQIATSGANDKSVRIWQFVRDKMEFEPRQRAMVDGKVLSISFCADGVLMAAGCSLKKSPNGYIVVWDLSNDAKVFCNLRSMTTARFGRVRCVEFLKRQEKGKHKQKSHLLFGGDTTGCILCWNLSLSAQRRTPVCVISGHSDIIYDLHIAHRRWLFSVSHDEQLRIADIAAFVGSDADAQRSVEYVFSKKLFSDDSKYPLKSIAYNTATDELVFGSRKCSAFKIGDIGDEMKARDDAITKMQLGTKDLDHIQHLEIGTNLLMVQRRGVNHVKLFSLDTNRMVKKFLIDKKTRINECGFTYDQKYAVLAVAGLANSAPCAIKVFKISKKFKTSK